MNYNKVMGEFEIIFNSFGKTPLQVTNRVYGGYILNMNAKIAQGNSENISTKCL